MAAPRDPKRSTPTPEIPTSASNASIFSQQDSGYWETVFELVKSTAQLSERVSNLAEVSKAHEAKLDAATRDLRDKLDTVSSDIRDKLDLIGRDVHAWKTAAVVLGSVLALTLTGAGLAWAVLSKFIAPNVVK